MPTVLLATTKPFAAEAVTGIEKICAEHGFTLQKLEKYTEQSELYAAAGKVDACIVRSDICDEAFFQAAKNLKVLVRAGAGVDTIDLAAATKAGVCVMNTPGQNSNAVAELAFGMLLGHKRNHFDGTSGTEIRGTSLGLYGCGNVSKYMIYAAQGFGMKVFAYDPFLTPEQIKAMGAEPLKDVPSLFLCNVVSLHIPATAQTKKSINAALIDSMPKGGVIINTARKEVIDEDDMVASFAKRSDLSYLCDVGFGSLQTVVQKFGAAQAKKQLLVTPKKMGAQTAEANINAGLAAANQIAGFLKKADATFQVNKDGKTF